MVDQVLEGNKPEPVLMMFCLILSKLLISKQYDVFSLILSPNLFCWLFFHTLYIKYKL
uniref:Uncharacterized protein n=1 Tax=Helianthus annuus TaxID=4232 RepID=A0A251UGF3_HELAN